MFRLLVLALLASPAALILADSFGQAGDSAKKKEKSIEYYCPVAGMPEVKTCGCPGGYCPRRPTDEITVPYKDAKIQLCCGKCTKLFKDAPEKFAVVANHQLVATGQARQIKCVRCGNSIGYVAGLKVAGIGVSFCSYDCLNLVNKADPKRQMEIVFGDEGFARAFEMVNKAAPSK